jgi:Flp pilus assembly protein TadD
VTRGSSIRAVPVSADVIEGEASVTTPSDTSAANPGSLLIFRGDYSKAFEQCRKAVEIDPNYWPAYSFCFGFGYERMGNHGEALKANEKAVAIEHAPWPIAFLGAAYARSGNREQARKVIATLNHLPAQTYVAPCLPAMVYVALGENRTALDLLEKAYQS